MARSIEKTNVDGYAVNGKCVLKAVMDVKINQLSSLLATQDFAVLKNVVSKKMTLEAVSTDQLKDYLGMEVILEPHLKTELAEFRINLPTNPKSIGKYLELIKNTKGKFVNDLIEKRVVVEVWEFYSVFESDIRFVIDPNLKLTYEGLLIPELEEIMDNVKMEEVPDEPSVLEMKLTDTKLKGDVIEHQLGTRPIVNE